MPLSHFPYGLSTFGYPVVPPIPFTGDSNYYYCDVVNGNDGNAGTDPSQAFKTIAKGYAALRAGHYDTLFVIGLGTAFPLTAVLVWSKNYTNLVGITAPIGIAQRARITNGTALLTPMITFSGTGITVKDLQFANFGDHATSAAVSVLITGQRGYYDTCHFIGGGSAAAAGNAAMRSLVGTGASENEFVNCTIGLDTIDRGATNYELEFTAACTRNRFRDCLFLRRTVTAGNGGGFAKFGAGSLDRFVIFERCLFHNSIVGGGAVLTAAMLIDAAAGGTVIIKNPLVVGATDWCVSSSAILWSDNQPSAATVGLGLNPTT